MQCPQCRYGLTTVTHRGVEFETCKTCQGLWFDSHEVVHYLHRCVQESDGSPLPHKESAPQLPPAEAGFCPRCNQLLEFHHIGASALHFRKCVNCSGVWLDRKNRMPLTRWFATASAYEQSPLYGRGNKNAVDLREGSLAVGLLDLFTDDNPVRRFPWATVTLILANTLVFTWSFFFREQAVSLYLVPNEAAFALHTFLTSMFMHADIFHLIGNMYCLWVFGDSMPAWLYIGILFFGFQILYAGLNIPGVAWFAHIGGFGAGFVSAFFLRQLNAF